MTYGKGTTLNYSNLYRQKFREHGWDCMLKVWDNGGRNIKLDQAKYIDMSSLSKGFHLIL